MLCPLVCNALRFRTCRQDNIKHRFQDHTGIDLGQIFSVLCPLPYVRQAYGLLIMSL